MEKHRIFPYIIFVIIFSYMAVWSVNAKKKSFKTEKGEAKMVITSSSFNNGAMIPSKYTCDGANISPPITWSDVPDSPKSYALICDDPDAPGGTWVHWVAYNIPPNVTGLQENVPTSDTLANGTRQGVNDFRKTGYGGPCPPGGTHRYLFKIYALDMVLPIEKNMTKTTLLKMIGGHIIAEGQLMGKYKR